MALTRNVTNLGRPENMFLSGSNQGAVTGCTSCGNPNIDRGMVGGQRVESAHDASIPMGPKGGLVGHKMGTSCGVSNPLNLGASSQVGGNYSALEEGNAAYGFDSAEGAQGLPGGAFSYPPISPKPQMSCQKGGKSHAVCHDVNKVHSYEQVHAFWSYICPGAVMIYKKHVKKGSKHAIHFVRHYTRAFCEEVNALQAKTDSKKRKHLANYRRHMKNAEKLLHKMNKAGHGDHMMVFNRHLNRIVGSMKSHGGVTKKHHKGGKKHSTRKGQRKSRSHGTRKHKSMSHKKHHKSRKHRNMRGGKGYHQFNSNVPRSPGYGLNQGALPKGGVLANPMPYQANNNCHDVYNHYTGVSSEAPARG
jgi:hypothetical protein